MSKIRLTYLPLCLILIISIVCLSFTEVQRASMCCTDVLVSIKKNPYHADFLNVEDVSKIMNETRNSLIGRKISEININEIESLIESDPTVLSCETYFTIKGKLHINITQRTPILRVVTPEKSFYIDEDGFQLPISSRGSARVLVASGNISDKYIPNVNINESQECSQLLKDVVTLTNVIRNDEVLLPMIEQIYVTHGNEFIMVSKVGPALIEFGTMDYYELKIKHLKAFYKSKKVREYWRLYSSISLKYKNQIVCTKI